MTMATREYYWLDGSAYCPDCVECDTPAIDAGSPHVQRGMAVQCSCCGAKGGHCIDISICPTDLPENNGCGDDHDPNVVLAALREFVDKVYPFADVRCLQIGHRQGDGWAVIDGDDDAGAQFVEDFWVFYN